MRLNGWQRIWVVASVPIVLGSVAGAMPSEYSDWKPWNIAAGVAFCVALYAIGFAVAWVRRGFRGE